MIPAPPAKAVEVTYATPSQAGIVTPILTINEGVILRMKERNTHPQFSDDGRRRYQTAAIDVE